MEDKKLIKRECFICGSNNYLELVKVPYLFPFYSKNEIYMHSLVKCKNCSNYYINPTVSDLLLSKYYSSETSYELYDNKDDMLQEYKDKLVYQENYMNSFLDLKKKTILDYGCATAYKLNEFKKDNMVFGFDTSKECAKIAYDKYGIEVFTDISTLKKKKFDFIILSHVLEHLREPSIVLKFLSSIMNDDGKIYIEVPYINTFNKMTNEENFGFITFEHLNYFNEINLSNLMEKLDFRLIDLRVNKEENGTVPYYNVIQSIWEKKKRTDKIENQSKISYSSDFETYIFQEKEKLEKFQKLIQQKVDKKRIIIYGVGTHTYRLLAMCPALKTNIVGFSDSNQKKYTEESFFDLSCKYISDYDTNDYDAILISSKASENEISAFLKNKTDKEIIKIYG